MEEYFKTTIEMEELSRDDRLILQKRLRIHNLVLKIFKYILLIEIALLVFLFLPSKYHENIDFGIKVAIAMFSIIITVCILVVGGMHFIYYRFVVEQALKSNYVVVCTGVLTEKNFDRGLQINIVNVFIWTMAVSLLCSLIKILKIGTCIQCRYIGTHTHLDYCISIKRYNQTMYDPEYILKVEQRKSGIEYDHIFSGLNEILEAAEKNESYDQKKFNQLIDEVERIGPEKIFQVVGESSNDLIKKLNIRKLVDEIVNYQMYQVQVGKKDGIKGILVAIVCKLMNPLYKIKYDNEQAKIVTMPDFKSRLRQYDRAHE